MHAHIPVLSVDGIITFRAPSPPAPHLTILGAQEGVLLTVTLDAGIQGYPRLSETPLPPYRGLCLCCKFLNTRQFLSFTLRYGWEIQSLGHNFCPQSLAATVF